jgi:hypothetical protein
MGLCGFPHRWVLSDPGGSVQVVCFQRSGDWFLLSMNRGTGLAFGMGSSADPTFRTR